MRLAPDTNLLCYPSTRTLLHGIALERDITLVVLPEVLEETCRRLRAIERGRIVDFFEAGTNLDDARQGEIVERAADQANAWFIDEIKREDTAYSAPENDWESAVKAVRIAKNLPRNIVPEAPPSPEGDALIIAQALVHKATVLSTNNLRTIEHELANKWVRKVTGVDDDLLLSPDETMRLLAKGDWRRVAHWIAMYNSRVYMRPAGERRRAFADSLKALDGGGFRESVLRSGWVLRTDQAFQSAMLAPIRAGTEVEAMIRRSEARLAEATRSLLVDFDL